jgi:hypothetical protein
LRRERQLHEAQRFQIALKADAHDCIMIVGLLDPTLM